MSEPGPDPRPRRSALFMPGSNARALQKAKTLAADVLIFDFEDAVAPGAKARAREQVIDAVNNGGFGARELVVRVNALGTPGFVDDIAAVAGLTVDAVLVAKVESAAQINAALAALDAAGAAATRRIWAMVETPRGVLAIADIAAASERLACMVLGTADLAKALRARPGPGRSELLPALSLCVLAARAHGLDILDGVHLDLDDDAGLRAACAQARAMGFDGKTLIHPKQIEASNEAFAPSTEELSHAEAIVKAWREERRPEQGVLVVQGRMVEHLHVQEAERTLAMAKAIAALRR